jgi:Arc/MetJ-type ribon-helix-helix transcriptional regulator
MYGTMARMVKTTVYLTPELKERLESLAARRGQSEADVIRTALETFAARERPRPRWPLVARGGTPTNDSERVDELLSEILEAELARDRGRE